ncbi:MAG: hypothetical protein FPO08_08685 [Geobacter sp.]|uniref:hypothetical protein n=1 Tax=Geomonas ferrireducens TaxID=2570227 RepID=UPI0010A81846|nr:hypothetical protein [Geomonas ferrireducens]TSK06723.1 MAG: hypothetical protein FPO08_08685 [Geobacter sp.]
MKALATLIVALLASVPQALAAAQDSAPAWNGFAATFFITFAATVFIFQLFPGAALFIGLLKGLFGAHTKREAAVKSRSTRIG